MYIDEVLVNKTDVANLITELAERVTYPILAREVDTPEEQLRQFGKGPLDPIETVVRDEIWWKLKRFINKYGFFDLLPPHGVSPVSYDLSTPFNLERPPVGFDYDPPLVPLIKHKTTIAGFEVDFPLGLPASVLAANSKWIEFYAQRGFDILTYKTVRTEYRKEHPWPNWAFLKDPDSISDPLNPQKMCCFPGYWPENRTTISMANSFGMPSLAPAWWQADIRRARDIIKEGHQVLIVSVVSSVKGDLQTITDDFVKAARMAKEAGAQIIEANYSCPNVAGDPVGEIYQSPECAAYISQALKIELGNTPLFVKIGYLSRPEIFEFTKQNAKFIDGIVAINTVSATIVDESGHQTFPGRNTAGISGWTIKSSAQEVVRNLVAARNELRKEQRKDFTILGLGGVLTSRDFDEFLKIGVDAVETCTGAFLNPYLGLEIRLDRDAIKRKPSRLAFEWEFLSKFVKDVITRPTKPSRIRANTKTRTVVVEPE